MKTIKLLLIALLFSCSSFSQINKTKVIERKEVKDKSPYDSLTNFLGKDVHKYIGQNLYVLCKPEALRLYGYENFKIDYQYKRVTDIDQITKDILSGISERSKNTYKCYHPKQPKRCYSSKYEDLEGRYFLVKNIFDDPENNDEKYYLELEESENKDVVYFNYDPTFPYSFPFLVVGFYEKEKNRLIGKEFIFKNEILKSSVYGASLDLITGVPNIVVTSEKWKCIDLTIEEKECRLSLIIENSNKTITTTVRHSVVVDGINLAFTPKESKKLITRFGLSNFKSILQEEVGIGMTKEMVVLSWGKPNDVNKTITKSNTSEQWIYEDNYLYFEGNKLTAIQ